VPQQQMAQMGQQPQFAQQQQFAPQQQQQIPQKQDEYSTPEEPQEGIGGFFGRMGAALGMGKSDPAKDERRKQREEANAAEAAGAPPSAPTPPRPASELEWIINYLIN
jgi:hypothetical protein